MKAIERAKFRVKVRSLMEEARIIRHEERKATRGADNAELHLHRVGSLRREARATALAYAYAGDRSYASVEHSVRRAGNCDAKRVAAIVRSLTFSETFPHDVEAWRKQSPVPVHATR